MKNLILKSVFFFSLLAGSYFLLIDKLSEGYVDMNYSKFTQEAGSLIIGLSRADQGIDPEILENHFHHYDLNGPLINFASNQFYFGETYFNAIKKKLNGSSGKRIFIIAVSPGSFSAPKGFGTKGIETMDENTPIGKTKDFTSNPNYSYIMNCYGSGLYTALIENRGWENLTPHDNGWNEVSLDSKSSPITPALISDWKNQNLAYYKRRLPQEEIKDYRKDWLIKTIEFLNTKGSVYLVRLPVDREILSFENQSWSDFNAYMESLAIDRRIPYFDYTDGPGEYATYDGSHLYSETAKEFSVALAKDLLEHDKSRDGFDP